MRFCEKCGAEILDGQAFCEKCLSDMNELKNDEQQFAQAVSSFVGKNAKRYLPIFANFRNGAKSWWNTAAFFFNSLWLFYRKMYLYGVLALLAELAIFYFGGKFAVLLNIAYRILCGFFGDRIYYHSFLKAKQRADWLDDEGAAKIYKKYGGTSIIVVVLMIAIAFAGNMMLYTLPQKPEKIVLSQSDAVIMRGKAIMLTYEILPSGATDGKIRWTSDDVTVATVAGGEVTAVKEGVCRITATTESGLSATCGILVVPRTAERYEECVPVGEWECYATYDYQDEKWYSSERQVNLTITDHLTGEIVAGDEKIAFTWQFYTKDDDGYTYITDIYQTMFTYTDKEELWMFFMTDDPSLLAFRKKE